MIAQHLRASAGTILEISETKLKIIKVDDNSHGNFGILICIYEEA